MQTSPSRGTDDLPFACNAGLQGFGKSRILNISMRDIDIVLSVVGAQEQVIEMHFNVYETDQLFYQATY